MTAQLTKAELADILFERVGLAKRESKEPSAFFAEIEDAWNAAKRLNFPDSAISSCATSRSARGATPRPAKKFPSRHGGWSPFTPARSSNTPWSG